MDQRHICGALLVGSWARGAATSSSDLDLLILSDEPGQLIHRDGWWSFLGSTRLILQRAWGPVVERRLILGSGLEVELGIAPRAWAQIPLDAGTRRVLSDGARLLHDPDGLLGRALSSLTG
jgi:hypothetical protein